MRSWAALPSASTAERWAASIKPCPLEDISWVLHEVRRFCVANALAYDGYPMHEVAVHPQAAHVLRLFREIWQVDFQPLPTTGVPLTTRSDWREILETLRELSAPTFWLPSMVRMRSTVGLRHICPLLFVSSVMKPMRPQARDEFEGIAMKEELEWHSLVKSR